jgi:hypothetical protein
MKKVLFVIFVMFSSIVNAGEVINKNTGDSLIFDMNREAKSITITLKSSTWETSKTVSFMEYEIDEAEGVREIKTRRSLVSNCGPCGPADGNPQILFRLSKDVYENSEEFFNHAWVGYFVPGFNILMIGAHLVDTVALPINITKKMIRNGYVKKDLKLLNTLLNSDEQIEVSSKQFRRLFYYIMDQK